MGKFNKILYISSNLMISNVTGSVQALQLVFKLGNILCSIIKDFKLVSFPKHLFYFLGVIYKLATWIYIINHFKGKIHFKRVFFNIII